MFPLRSFEVIPQAYPNRIIHKKNKLFPLAVFALSDFRIDIGQDTPKLTTMNTSNSSAI
jgi:hypothetical protein